jgi:hypothetical protein
MLQWNMSAELQLLGQLLHNLQQATAELVAFVEQQTYGPLDATLHISARQFLTSPKLKRLVATKPPLKQ